MSYHYLFKFIIIGDTGTGLQYFSCWKVMHIVSIFGIEVSSET